MSHSQLPIIGKILIIDDNPDNLEILFSVLKNAGNSVSLAINGTLALAQLDQVNPDIILLDINMPGTDGFEVCRQIKSNPKFCKIPVLFISAHDNNEDKINAFRLGGVDYITKPFYPEEVLARIETHLSLLFSRRKLEEQKHLLEKEIEDRERTEQALSNYQEKISGLLQKKHSHPTAFKTIVTQSQKILNLFAYIEALTCSDEPVLILGESGTGKELFAKAIHDVCCPESPFVVANVAGFDDVMFSDTLFGHVRGAFTGASTDRQGLIEKAKNGILFLDEFGDLPLNSQVKLLRLLQEGDYYPLGTDTPRKNKARIVVATNANLTKKIQEGEFRQDLYYRLISHTIDIPPLRERLEDLPLLLDYFITNLSLKMGKKAPSYPCELVLLLKNYIFPGNVRELRAMVMSVLSAHQKGMLSMAPFEEMISAPNHDKLQSPLSDNDAILFFNGPIPTIRECSSLLVLEALKRTENNQNMAAKMLGITPGALSSRLKKMNEKGV